MPPVPQPVPLADAPLPAEGAVRLVGDAEAVRAFLADPERVDQVNRGLRGNRASRREAARTLAQYRVQIATGLAPADKPS